MYNTAVTWYEV